MNEQTNRKKILIFSLSYFPRFVGGAEVAIKEITDRLGDDFEFHMITLRFDSNTPRESKEGNVLVHRIGWGSPNMTVKESFNTAVYLSKIFFVPLAALKARSLNKTYSYDGMWAMMSYMVLPIVLFRMFSKKIPYILTLQEGDPFEYVYKRWYIRPFSFLLKMGFKSASAVQVISNFLAGWARTMGATHVEVIHNGVDLERMAHEIAPSRRNELRIKMRAKEDETLLITTSRLVYKNGIDTAIEALSELEPRIKFAIAGDGPEESKLKDLSASLGLNERITFLGSVPPQGIPDYLHASDIFIRISRSEGMGNSFVEAMAAGLPTIGTAVGGITDFLREGDTGFVVSPDNAQSVREAIMRVINEPEKTRVIEEKAREVVRNQFDWNTVAQRMQELLKSCISVVR